MEQMVGVTDAQQSVTQFKVIQEYCGQWPTNSLLHLEVPGVIGEIRISPTVARRRAKGYLTGAVALAFRPGEPVLVWGRRPVWRMAVHLHLRGYGRVVELGTVDVDATTGDVIALLPSQIASMQDQADVIARRLAPKTTTAS